MHIAGIVVLDEAVGSDPTVAREVIAQRLGEVPRLRQVLVASPIGCGRAHWVGAPGFDPHDHVAVMAAPARGDDATLLDTALELAARPLPRSRPLWSATLLTGLAGRRAALVVVLHHVLADGLGGLAVLMRLVDEGADPRVGTQLRRSRSQLPSRGALAADAWTTRLRTLRSAPKQLRASRAALAELGASRAGLAPATSLNRPIGARRTGSVVRADLADVAAVAHHHGGTVNDVVLTAVTGALGSLLARRGESTSQLVVSVPVSGRTSSNQSDLGNQVGVIPVALPTTGDPVTRLRSVIATTRSRKTSTPGASATLLQPAFRGLATLGVLGWFINRQRLVNAFVTNVRGPTTPITFMGVRVREVIPVSGIQGNVPVAFTVLSYAGVLGVTVIADPDAVPDHGALTAMLQRELDVLAADPSGGP